MSVLAASLLQTRLEQLWSRVASRRATVATRTPGADGIWLSTYTYTSGEDGRAHTSQHYIRVLHRGGRLTGTSLPKPEGSRVTLTCRFENGLAIGEWREITSKGRLYRGAIELLLEGAAHPREQDARPRLAGVWVGLTRRNTFQTGPWRLELVVPKASRRVRREFADRGDLA